MTRQSAAQLRTIANRRDEVVRLTQEGKTRVEIAKALGVTEQTVRRYRALTGVKSHRTQLREYRRNLIEEKTAAGWSTDEIAKHLNVTTATIFKYRRRARAGASQDSPHITVYLARSALGALDPAAQVRNTTPEALIRQVFEILIREPNLIDAILDDGGTSDEAA
jgi:DNA-binding CsgD family transcriptional regulator